MHQQRDFISAQTGLRVSGFFGEIGDFWNREEWTVKLADSDVVVSTAQVFLNILHHAYHKIDRISLLVFDEAHHCTKKHPYAQVYVTLASASMLKLELNVINPE